MNSVISRASSVRKLLQWNLNGPLIIVSSYAPAGFGVNMLDIPATYEGFSLTNLPRKQFE